MKRKQRFASGVALAILWIVWCVVWRVVFHPGDPTIMETTLAWTMTLLTNITFGIVIIAVPAGAMVLIGSGAIATIFDQRRNNEKDDI